MKKCKKLTALLMASIMGLSLFGCSSGKDAPTTAASQAPETKAPETKARPPPQRLLKLRRRRM